MICNYTFSSGQLSDLQAYLSHKLFINTDIDDQIMDIIKKTKTPEGRLDKLADLCISNISEPYLFDASLYTFKYAFLEENRYQALSATYHNYLKEHLLISAAYSGAFKISNSIPISDLIISLNDIQDDQDSDGVENNDNSYLYQKIPYAEKHSNFYPLLRDNLWRGLKKSSFDLNAPEPKEIPSPNPYIINHKKTQFYNTRHLRPKETDLEIIYNFLKNSTLEPYRKKYIDNPYDYKKLTTFVNDCHYIKFKNHNSDTYNEGLAPKKENQDKQNTKNENITPQDSEYQFITPLFNNYLFERLTNFELISYLINAMNSMVVKLEQMKHNAEQSDRSFIVLSEIANSEIPDQLDWNVIAPSGIDNPKMPDKSAWNVIVPTEITDTSNAKQLKWTPMPCTKIADPMHPKQLGWLFTISPEFPASKRIEHDPKQLEQVFIALSDLAALPNVFSRTEIAKTMLQAFFNQENQDFSIWRADLNKFINFLTTCSLPVLHLYFQFILSKYCYFLQSLKNEELDKTLKAEDATLQKAIKNSKRHDKNKSNDVQNKDTTIKNKNYLLETYLKDELQKHIEGIKNMFSDEKYNLFTTTTLRPVLGRRKKDTDEVLDEVLDEDTIPGRRKKNTTERPIISNCSVISKSSAIVANEQLKNIKDTQKLCQKISKSIFFDIMTFQASAPNIINCNEPLSSEEIRKLQSDMVNKMMSQPFKHPKDPY